MKLINQSLDKVIDFSVPIASTELSMLDKTEIISMTIKHWLLHNDPMNKHFPGTELLLLDWTWLDALNRTLTARFVYVLEKAKATMTPSFYGKIGNRIRETIPTAAQYFLDFTRTFDWVSGQYGDGRSCFMNGGARKGVLNEMTLNGNFYAMRFYQTEPIKAKHGMVLLANTIPKYTVDGKKFFGNARTWLHYRKIKTRFKGKITEEGVYFMFNCYGKQSLRESAAIFSAFVGGSFRPIKLKNIGKTAGGLYINSNSMVIGRKEIIQDMDTFDFAFKTTYDEKQRTLHLDGGIPERFIEFRTRYNRFNRMHGYKAPYFNKTKEPKKLKHTNDKRRPKNEVDNDVLYLLNDVVREWLWSGKWTKGNAFQNLINPTKLRGSWKLLVFRHSDAFYPVLIKLINHKINGGFNDNSHESKDKGKRKTKRTQPTLRRNENHRPGLDQPIIDDVEFDFIQVQER